MQDSIIRDAWLHFGSIPHGMTILSQPIHNLAIDTLVGKKPHLAASATG
jgi:hypothetical protein